MGAVLAVDSIVGAHNGGDTSINALLEVGEIDLPQGTLVDTHVHVKAGLLDGVAGIVFGAGHDVILQAAYHGRPHGSKNMGILAEGFLGTPPAWMAEEVYTHTCEEIRSVGTCLNPHRRADAFLQPYVPGGRSSHGNREACAVSEGYAAWPVREPYGRDSQMSIAAALKGIKAVTD